MRYKYLLSFLDQNGKTNTDEELENISFESLSTHPTRTDSINALHCFGNGSVNSYYNSGKFTGMDAKKNCQFGTTSSSADEEMKSSSLMPPNTHSTKTAGNASYIMGNGPVDNERIDTGRDAKENYQFGMIRNSLNLVNDHSISAISDLLKSFYF